MRGTFSPAKTTALSNAVMCGLLSSFSMMVGTTDSLEPEKYPLNAESSSVFSFMIGDKGNPYTVQDEASFVDVNCDQEPKKIELTVATVPIT